MNPDDFKGMISLKNIPEELILSLFCHRSFCVGLLQVIANSTEKNYLSHSLRNNFS